MKQNVISAEALKLRKVKGYQPIAATTPISDLGLDTNKVHSANVSGEVKVFNRDIEGRDEGVKLFSVPVEIDGKPANCSMTADQFDRFANAENENEQLGLNDTIRVTIQSYERKVKNTSGEIEKVPTQYLSLYTGEKQTGDSLSTITVEDETTVGATEVTAN